MTQQLELFEDMPLMTWPVAVGDDWESDMHAVLDKFLPDPYVIRKRRLDGLLIGSQYAHLSLNEAALQFFVETANPAQVSAWILALLAARVRPPQREAIGSSPKQHLKRRSGHQAREPPLHNFQCAAR